jgi:hypothetical protein
VKWRGEKEELEGWRRGIEEWRRGRSGNIGNRN